MRIALVGAEFEENLAIRYIWGALQHAGYSVQFIRFNERSELDRAARELARSDTDLAGFSMVFTYRAREFADLATKARELGYHGHMVAGGHVAAFNADSLLRDVPAFDSVAIGEGEEIMCDLAAHLGGPRAVCGLVWRNEAGEIIRNEPAVKPPDLDRLPYPVRKQPFDSYLGIPIVNMLSSRGCTHSCAFCSIAAWHKLCGGPRHRMRSPESVADEMADLYEQGVRIFNFHDDNFLPRDRTEAFERVRALRAELDGRRLGRIAFAIKARPDSVDERLFAYLKSMGLFRVFLGIEAGTDEALRHLGRNQTVADNERALAIVDMLDLHCCFNLLLFNPWSTLEDIAANVAFLRRHPHNPMSFCRTEVYAGTLLEAQLRREGRLLGDYWGYDYQIADPSAQVAFEVVSRAFEHRNYGTGCLHERGMTIDYEHQLLTHFLRAAPDLRSKIKQYLVAVNLNTADHLARLQCAAKPCLPKTVRSRLVPRAARELAVDTRKLLASGQFLRRKIGAMAGAQGARGITRRGWLREASAGSLLAAASTFGISACDDNTHPHERPATHLKATGGDPSLVRGRVSKEILPRIAAKLPGPRALQMWMSLGPDGKIDWCDVREEVSAAQVEAPDLSDVKFEDSRTHGKTFLLVFTAQEVKSAMELGAGKAGSLPEPGGHAPLEPGSAHKPGAP